LDTNPELECVTVKKITVSLSDEIYRRARIKAAVRDASVSALVREFLISLGEEESDFKRRKRLQDEILGSVKRFSASDRLKREAIHRRGRRAFSGRL
jgi:hypothetical protein